MNHKGTERGGWFQHIPSVLHFLSQWDSQRVQIRPEWMSLELVDRYEWFVVWMGPLLKAGGLPRSGYP